MGRRALVILVGLLLTVVAGFAVYQFLVGIDAGSMNPGLRSEVEEIRLLDGTRCVVLLGPGIRSGIDCEWPNEVG